MTNEHATELRSRWMAGSFAGIWKDPTVWWCDAVEAATEVLTGGTQNSREVFKLLGRSRAVVGVPLDEARADAQAASTAAGVDELGKAKMLDAVTVGWITYELESRVSGNELVDPLTGLADSPYFLLRYTEVLAEAKSKGENVAESHALVIVNLLHRGDPIERETSMITIQTCLRRSFDRGQTVFRVGRHCAAALTAREGGYLQGRLPGLQADLARAFEMRLLGRTRCWIEPLPPALESVSDMLLELRR